MIFVIPRANKTYFGTTDTDYTGDYLHPKVEQVDVDYLLATINNHFPKAHITIDDVQASWAGLRPLIGGAGDYNGNTTKKTASDESLHELGANIDKYFNNEIERQEIDDQLKQLTSGDKSASSVSRGFQIKVENGIVNVSGGKLTDYRLMASETLTALTEIFADKFATDITPVDSTTYPVSGGHFDFQNVDAELEKYAEMLEEYDVNEVKAKEIANLYGSNTPQIIEYIKTGVSAPKLSVAETSMLHYAIDKEFVLRPIDYFLRRTNYLLFKSEDLDRLETPVINEMAKILDWSDETKQAMTEEYTRLRDEAQLRALKKETE
jgi:glycerol-3-phosphate dehydrogenase